MKDEDTDRRARLMGGELVQRRQRQRTRKNGLGALGGLLDRRRELRGSRGGETFHAILRRDGTIKFGTRVFASPSSAAKAAVGASRNGWTFWRYRDKSGEWVPLRTLRQ